MAASPDDATRDVIYRLLLAKLMETPTVASVSVPVAAATGGYPQGTPSTPNGAASSSLSPPSSGSSSSSGSCSASFGTPSPVKERMGTKRPSPFPADAPPPHMQPPPGLQPPGQATPLPNFLLVRLPDVRDASRLQTLLASHGFHETRLVLADGSQGQATAPITPQPCGQTPSFNGTGPSPPSSVVGAFGGGQLGGPQSRFAPPAHQNHRPPQQQQQQFQSRLPFISDVLGGSAMEGAMGTSGHGRGPVSPPDHRSSISSTHSAYMENTAPSVNNNHVHVPDAVREEVVKGEEDEDENVDVVDSPMPSSHPLGSMVPPPAGPSSRTPSMVSYSGLGAASPPSHGEEGGPPTDLQVAEVRHRSVSRSDCVDNEDVYVKCRLCDNRIMNTRLSNLTNHVRRHAKLKQFQCTHCSYEHNEIFKVRTHMSRTHGDASSAPVDRRSPEMERQWEALMHACFPRNTLVQNGGGAKGGSPGGMSSHDHYNATGPYTCSVCQESIPSVCLHQHARDAHREAVAALSFHVCRECGYKAADMDDVRSHALSTHDVADVVAVEVENRPTLLVAKLFPDRKVVTNEEVECSQDGLEAGTEEGDEEYECKMCSRILRSHSWAIEHARHHYPTRQFHCTLCLYSAVASEKVKSHMLARHATLDEPIDVADDGMHRGWLDTLESCFPALAVAIAPSVDRYVSGMAEDCESDSRRRREEQRGRNPFLLSPPLPSIGSTLKRNNEEEDDIEIDVV